MPYISIFFGIVIKMFYNEHNPPHFHAYYQGMEGIFDFNGNLIKGNIAQSKTALKLIKEWACLNRYELEQNWKRIKSGKPLQQIKPLQ
ncbi:DUF4160 domain-containing protein [Desulfovulcanus sp.]